MYLLFCPRFTLAIFFPPPSWSSHSSGHLSHLHCRLPSFTMASSRQLSRPPHLQAHQVPCRPHVARRKGLHEKYGDAVRIGAYQFQLCLPLSQLILSQNPTRSPSAMSTPSNRCWEIMVFLRVHVSLNASIVIPSTRLTLISSYHQSGKHAFRRSRSRP